MLEDRGNYSKVPAQAAGPVWAEKKRLEMFLCPASERVKQGHQDERLLASALEKERKSPEKQNPASGQFVNLSLCWFSCRGEDTHHCAAVGRKLHHDIDLSGCYVGL